MARQEAPQLDVLDLVRDDDGDWTAHVQIPGSEDAAVAVDKKFGSWRLTPVGEGDLAREVRPWVAVKLQDAVRSAEGSGPLGKR